MQVETQGKVMVKIKQSGQKRIAKATSECTCFYCLQPLGDERVVRKCHERCYKILNSRVNSGKETDKDLVAKGYWASCDTPGRKPTEPAEIA